MACQCSHNIASSQIWSICFHHRNPSKWAQTNTDNHLPFVTAARNLSQRNLFCVFSKQADFKKIFHQQISRQKVDVWCVCMKYTTVHCFVVGYVFLGGMCAVYLLVPRVLRPDFGHVCVYLIYIYIYMEDRQIDRWCASFCTVHCALKSLWSLYTTHSRYLQHHNQLYKNVNIWSSSIPIGKADPDQSNDTH